MAKHCLEECERVVAIFQANDAERMNGLSVKAGPGVMVFQ